MEFNVLTVSCETENFSSDDLEVLKTMSGKDAGICYQRGSYFNSSVSDPEKAHTRFGTVATTGHHSIADHAKIKVYMSNISKMLAIVLNSLQYYDTSEKSGRYTEMVGNSEHEQELYNKWLGIFRNRILEIKPDIDDSMLINLMAKNGHDDVIITNGQLSNNNMADDEVHQSVLAECKTNVSLPSVKMAQENARYILSVFTYSTSLSYTTSLRQWNYIYDWAMKYCNQYIPKADEEYIKVMAGGTGNVTLLRKSDKSECTYFEERLYYDLLNLANFIYDTLYVPELRDFKNRCFEFLTDLSGNKDCPMVKYDLSPFEYDWGSGSFTYDENTHSPDDVIDTVYSVSYIATFTQIAQAERHRTLKYFMRFNPSNKVFDFFVPPMIVGTKYEAEWLEDLDSVKNLYPQATKVGIIETGHISDFILKCEERLCGRAQLETMNQTKLTALRFLEHDGNAVFNAYKEKLRGSHDGLKTKGEMIDICKEGCMWGCKNGLNRRI